MQLRIYDPRIIALELRPRRTGFAILEGPRNLLDYGTLSLRSQIESDIGKTLMSLFRQSLPSVIVVKRERWNAMTVRPGGSGFAEHLREYAEEQNAEIRLLEELSLALAFENLGCETKVQVAAAVARIFPELAWKVPPERRI